MKVTFLHKLTIHLQLSISIFKEQVDSLDHLNGNYVIWEINIASKV